MSGTEQSLVRAAELFEGIRANIGRVMLGIDDAISHALCCVLSGGHLLIEDVPGTGKTTLATALAHSVSASVARIQFTPDLLPADITGYAIYVPSTEHFDFHPGPIFHNIVIASEINRASPRTQSALLEAMSEARISVDGNSYALPNPFSVIATQNPVDFIGTYRLPEAQMDLFDMRLTLGHPDHDTSRAIVESRIHSDSPIADVRPVVTIDSIPALVQLARTVVVDPEIVSYVVRVAAASRGHANIRLGVSLRGCIALLRLAQVRALSMRRKSVTPEDVKILAPLAWGHRIFLTPEAEMNGITSSDLIVEIAGSVAAPSAAI